MEFSNGLPASPIINPSPGFVIPQTQLPTIQQPQGNFLNNGDKPHPPCIGDNQVAILGLLDCLSNQKEFFISQRTNFNCREPKTLQILDESRNHFLSANVHSFRYMEGRFSNRRGRKSTIYTVTNFNRQVVLQFLEEDGSADITSGGLSIGIMHAPSCCSNDLSGSTSTEGDLEIFTAREELGISALFPFGINSFILESSGNAIGKFERIHDGLLKISIPREMEVGTKGLILALALKGYTDYFANIYGCSSGSNGPRNVAWFVFLLAFAAVVITIVIFGRGRKGVPRIY